MAFQSVFIDVRQRYTETLSDEWNLMFKSSYEILITLRLYTFILKREDSAFSPKNPLKSVQNSLSLFLGQAWGFKWPSTEDFWEGAGETEDADITVWECG